MNMHTICAAQNVHHRARLPWPAQVKTFRVRTTCSLHATYKQTLSLSLQVNLLIFSNSFSFRLNQAWLN